MAENRMVEDGDLNHLRLISLLAECSKECLLKLFHTQLKKNNLSFQEFVSTSTDRIQELKNEGVFTQDEVNMLNPSHGDETPVNLDKFDVRLIFLLLQHLTPDPKGTSYSARLKGNLAVPEDDELSISAELKRIQICKNQIMHQRTRFNDDEFDQLFSEIQETCIRMLIRAKSSKKDVTAMRKKIKALKKSKMEDLKENFLQNVMQCFRWSAGDMDGIDTRLASFQMKTASIEQYDEVDASRMDNLSHLQDEVSSLTSEVQVLTIEEGSKNEASLSKEDQSFVQQQQLETLRQHLAGAYESMQENVLDLLSKGYDYSGLGGYGDQSGKDPNPIDGASYPILNGSTSGPYNSTPTVPTIEEKELLYLCNQIDTGEFRDLRINLDFEMAQWIRLIEAYPDVNERIYAMLKAWHDTVISCGENPRHLLAVALQASGNRLLAIKLISGEELNSIVHREANKNTKDRIKEIKFSKPQEEKVQPVVINYGAPNSINVIGGELVSGGPIIIGTDKIDSGFPSAASSWSTGRVGSAGSRSNLHQTSSSASIHNFGQPNSLNILGGRVTTTPGSYIALGRNMSIWSPPSPVGSSKGDSKDAVPNKHGNLKKDDDDSVTQSMTDIYRQNMTSVGAIMCFNRTLGTGFRVGTKYIATAWHVIAAIIDPRRCGKPDILNLQQACIVFSNDPYEPSATKYHFNTNFVYPDQELDVAVLEISNTDGMMPRGLSLRKERFCRADADKVSIIGYGHQKNNEKNWEYRCPLVEKDSPEVTAAKAFVHEKRGVFKTGLLAKYPFSVVDQGYQGYDADNRMLLHCFMEKGASGSPILACVNPSARIVEVVGVLTSGMPEFFHCLKEDFKYLLPSKYRFEAGTRIRSIYQNMTGRHPNLAADLFV